MQRVEGNKKLAHIDGSVRKGHISKILHFSKEVYPDLNSHVEFSIFYNLKGAFEKGCIIFFRNNSIRTYYIF